MPFEPLQILGAGAVGFASAGGLRWWQYRRDLWMGRVGRFQDSLFDAADCATEYWLVQDETPADAPGPQHAERDQDRRIAEAKLLGFQSRMDGLFASISERLLDSDRAKAEQILRKMTDALTGGNFGSRRRPIDIPRSQSAQTYAAELLVVTQLAADNALSVFGTLRYWWERAHRRQDAAIGRSG